MPEPTSRSAMPIRVGIVGASITSGSSDWAAHAHIPALRALPAFELTAVCTSRPATASASAEHFGAALGFHDVAAMSAHPDVDLVVVALRVPAHRDAVLTALPAGKPIFCEWPLGVDLDEGRELAAAADVSGQATFVGLQARSDPAVAYARDLLAQGAVGKVVSATADSVSALQVICRPARAWMAERSAGANTLTIQAGHTFDLLGHLLGDVTEFSARVATQVRTWSTTEGQDIAVTSPDCCLLVGRTAHGAEVAVSVRAVPFGVSNCTLVVNGTQGELRVMTGGPVSVGPYTISIRDTGGAAESLPVPERYLRGASQVAEGPARNVAYAYARIAEQWHGEVSTRTVPDFAEAVALHQLIATAERSSRDGIGMSRHFG